jgi:hypothetical protein
MPSRLIQEQLALYRPLNDDKRAIYVGFSTTNKIVSRVIRWFLRSTASHAWISFYDETLAIRFVLQAEAWGLELRPWCRWLKQNRLVALFAVHPTSLERVRQNLVQQSNRIGTEYDFTNAIRVGLARFIRRVFRITVSTPIATPHKVFCSEIVYDLIRTQLDELHQTNPETIDPEYLKQCVEASPHFERLTRVLSKTPKY